MKALILNAEERTADVKDIPKPIPGPGEILVEVKAIALNPVDPLYVAHPLGKSGRTVGSDFAGVVAALGESVSGISDLKLGDRVAGFLQGASSVNERPGAFAEYLTVDWDLVWKIPDGVETEVASGASLVALTAAQGMWFRLGFQTPFSSDRNPVRSASGEAQEPINFFIYGASTSVGLYAAQMIRLSAKATGKEIKLFGAAGKANWTKLKSGPYSYDQLVDYRDENWPEQVRKLSGNVGIHFAYDCISEDDSVAHVSSTLAKDGKIAIVRSRTAGAWKTEQVKVEPVYGAVWEGLGREVQYTGFTVRESPEARQFAVQFYKWLSNAAGRELQLNPIRLMPGGLEKVVEDGFQLLGPGTMGARRSARSEDWMRPISAEKVVYRVQ